MNISDEQRIAVKMIGLYCKKKHKSKTHLCEKCEELKLYVEEKLQKCPFRDEKSACSNCKIHCYAPVLREKIREVMKFSGIRMLLYHPVVAMRHIKEKIKLQKKGKK